MTRELQRKGRRLSRHVPQRAAVGGEVLRQQHVNVNSWGEREG